MCDVQSFEHGCWARMLAECLTTVPTAEQASCLPTEMHTLAGTCWTRWMIYSLTVFVGV